MVKRRTYRKIVRNTQPRGNKICKGDQVIVKTGVSRGQVGTVLSLHNNKVIVQGVNVRKKHTKPQEGIPGGILEREMPIHISNLCACVNGKPVKVKTRSTDGGGRELYYMDGENAVTYRTIKK